MTSSAWTSCNRFLFLRLQAHMVKRLLARPLDTLGLLELEANPKPANSRISGSAYHEGSNLPLICSYAPFVAPSAIGWSASPHWLQWPGDYQSWLQKQIDIILKTSIFRIFIYIHTTIMNHTYDIISYDTASGIEYTCMYNRMSDRFFQIFHLWDNLFFTSTDL